MAPIVKTSKRLWLHGCMCACFVLLLAIALADDNGAPETYPITGIFLEGTEPQPTPTPMPTPPPEAFEEPSIEAVEPPRELPPPPQVDIPILESIKAMAEAVATPTSAPVVTPAPTPTPTPTPEPIRVPTEKEPLDLNTASEIQLEKLPGIDAVRANLITAHRSATGGFTEKNDLRDVYGLSDELIDRLLPLVTVRTLPPEHAWQFPRPVAPEDAQPALPAP